MHIDIVIYSVILSFLESFAQTNLKSGNLLIGIIGYMLVAYSLYYLYTRFKLSSFNIIWSSVSIVSAALIGYVLYKEDVNIYKKFAILFALIAIYLADHE